MKGKLRKLLMVLLGVAFLASTGMLLRQMSDNARGEDTYSDALMIASQTQVTQPSVVTEAVVTEPVTEPATEPETQPPTEPTEPVRVWVSAPVEGDPAMEEMAAIDLAALREVNEDVVGWIRIPGTNIDYPLMQGEDNQFYLHHTWDKEANKIGSIFLETCNSSDLTDFNTIVYGHNMRTSAMFGELPNYSMQTYWEKHPYVYIASDSGVYRYSIFAFFQAEVESLTYGLGITKDETKAEFLAISEEKNWIDTGLMPSPNDRVLTLSTCTGGSYAYRYVVQAYLPMVETTA